MPPVIARRALSADTLDAAATYTPAVTGAVARTYVGKLSDSYDPMDFGAVADGTSHPLSGYFGTLGAAQAIYPHATALTNQIDWAACQAATNAAKAASTALGRAVPVVFPAGTFLIDQPLVKPRSGNDRIPTVPCLGAGRNVTFIVGHTTFPSNRSLIEWEAVVDTVWADRIEDLGFRTPDNVAGVRCIWHKSQKSGGMNAVGTVLADVQAEWFQCHMRRLRFEGNNQVNEVFIDLEIGNRYAIMEDLEGDPWRGLVTPPFVATNYDTLLLRVADSYGGIDAPEGEDSVGLGWCKIHQLQPMVLRGGWVKTFQGRIYGEGWDGAFNNGPMPGRAGAYGYDFRNCWGVKLEDLNSEGGSGDTQFRFYKCRAVKCINFTVPVGTVPAAVTSWQATHAYAAGAVVNPTLLVSSSSPAPANRVYTTTGGGTSGGTEPNWANAATAGATIVDGTVTWTASQGNGVANGIKLESCEGVKFEGNYIHPGSPVPSYRLTKHISIDANSRNNGFEKWQIRGVVSGGANTVNTDVLPEVSVLGSGNSISGDLVQLVSNFRLPFTVGVDPQKLPAYASYRGDDNLIEAATQFDNVAWGKTNVTITADAAVDPFGIQRADKIVESAANVQHSTSQTYVRGAVQKQQVFSVYLKAAERTTATIYLSDNTGFLKADCNLVSGAITASVLVAESGMTLDGSGSTNVGGGWWRFWIVGTLPAATTFSSVYIFPNTFAAYLGDGTSGIYAVFGQLENAALPGPPRDPNPTLYVGVNFPVLRMDAAMRVNRTVTLSTTGAYQGARFEIYQSGGGAFTRSIGGLKTIPASTDAKVEVVYDGVAWRLNNYAADNDALIAGKAATSHTHTLSNITDAGTAASKTAGNAVGNVPMVESGGTLNASIIPSIAATHVYVDASQAAMLAHGSAVIGDISKRTDLGTSFVLSALPSSTLGNWISITDGGAVNSVNGLTGTVVLATSNIAESGNLYYTTARTNTDAPNVTLTAAAQNYLSLTAQQIDAPTKTAHFVLAGPTSGGAAAMVPRLLVDTDLPTHNQDESTITSGTGGLVADLAAKVPTSRIISTTSPLTGGGGLSGDLTLSVNAATTTASGISELATLAEANAHADAVRAVTPAALAGHPLLAGGNGFTGAQTYTVADAATRMTVQAALGGGFIGGLLVVKNDAGTVVATLFGDGGISAVGFSGDGAGLTGLNATNLASGTVPLTRLSASSAGAAGTMSAADFSKLSRLGTVVSAGTITTNYTPDSAAGDVFDITLGAATVTINAPTNPVNGRKVVYRLRQDGTGNRAVAWNAVFRFGSDITGTTLSTAINKTDYVATVYNGTDSKWDVTAFIKGF